jgi:hypothetical protein
MASALQRFSLTAGMLLIMTHARAQSRPAVLELFTSQGCSSCPTADAYVGELSARADVLALSFHVDYWDDLGWRDRFELPEAVRRQNVYARVLRRSSVYTPQLVVDGRDDYVGSDREAIAKAVAKRRDGIPVGISIESTDVKINVSPSPSAAGGDVLLVSYLRKATSVIGKGENAGRTLQEFNIVRGIRTLGHWTGSAQTFRVPLASLPSDATDVAILVQSPGQAPIIGAASHSIR